MILFPDQEKLLEETRQKLRDLPAILAARGISRKPRILLQAPPGFGKTVISAFIAKSLSDGNRRSWFICARDFLMAQTALTYSKIEINYSYMAAGMPMDISALAHVCMIGSMASRAHRIEQPKLALWDECHHINARTWAKQMDALPDSIHIGLTATPERLDGQGLDQYFDTIVCGPSVRYLIDNNRLADYEYYIPSKPDFSSVGTQAGEYKTSDAVEAMKAVLVGDIVATYKHRANGLRAVYFATSIELSKRYAEAFNSSGIPAAHIDKDTPKDERTRIAKAMASGEIKVITNVFILGEGFDLSAQAGMAVTVDCVGLCFRTKSLGKLIQCAMRCMRFGARGIILDHGNNYDEHGWLPDDDVEWTLSGSKRLSDIQPTYQCDGCGAILKRGSHICLQCGCDNSEVIREIKLRKEIEHQAGQLERIERENRIKQEEEDRKAARITQGRAKTLDDLIKIGRERGYKNPSAWAKFVYKGRMRA